MIELCKKSDGQIYSSPEMRDWFHEFLPEDKRCTFVLDGDLPKREWFTNDVSPKLSATDGAIHTVVPGRPIGLHPPDVAALASHNIHLHFYGDFTHGQWRAWIEKTQTLAPGFLHIHPNCPQQRWVQEFSQYDAGWLHLFASTNGGELMKARWDDLNYPARMATLAMAGLPMLQGDNTGHTVAMQSLVRENNLGIFFKTFADLSDQLRDQSKVHDIASNVWSKREMFCFDHYVDDLADFFKVVIASKKANTVHTATA